LGGGGADVLPGARKLFDVNVAWLSAILVLAGVNCCGGSARRLSTLLLIIIFIGLTWCILLMERSGARTEATHRTVAPVWPLQRERWPAWERSHDMPLAGGLVPVLLFLILFGGQQRGCCVR